MIKNLFYVLIFAIGFLFPVSLIQTTEQTTQSVGVSIPSGTAIFETSLQSPITSSASTMTLTANSVRGGTSLSGYQCFTIDEGSAQSEFVCGTISGTTVSSLTRGVDPFTGTSTNATLQFTHRRGANVKITDFPLIQIMRNLLNGGESFPNKLSYASAPSFSSALEIITKGYADALVAQGVATSSESNFGGVWLATKAQQASSTDGGVNKPYVLQSKYATSSPSGSGAGLFTLILNAAGKIAQSAIDLTEAYIWTGLHTFSSGITVTGNSTLATTTVNGYTLVREYGGTGADGALSITSGTTTLDLGSADYYVKNYSSISITGTGSLAFINPGANGTIIVLKSQGNVTVTSTANPAINISGLGATSTAYAINNGGGPGAGTSGSASADGTAGRGTYSIKIPLGKNIPLFVGSGGGIGWGGSDTNLGGTGGGSLYIESTGALNITSTINAAGTNGETGAEQGSSAYHGGGGGGSQTTGVNGSGGTGTTAGGGGGGGGGTIVILYDSLTANSGTYTVTGGAGGSAGGGAGGTGYSYVGPYSNF